MSSWRYQCPICGEWFEAKTYSENRMRTCSSRCRQAQYRARHARQVMVDRELLERSLELALQVGDTKLAPQLQRLLGVRASSYRPR